MSEYKRPTSEEEFNENFSQKKALMNSTEAYYESSRCLFCYDAPCMQACPTEIDVPLFIKQINSGNIEGSARTIFDSNWLGNACGKVCPTGVLCEGACVYNLQDVPAIQIGRLQNYATNKIINDNVQLYQAGLENGKKVAVVGAGPAGISCACELRKLGYHVDIFEAKSKPSGLTVYGIAPYKITNEEVLDEISWLQNQLGFNIKYNAAVETKEKIKEIENEYDAIFLGVGLGATGTLGIPGEDLANVIGAVEFIEALRINHHKLKIQDKVIVIGGGNTAMDAASESARMGAEEVTLAYRRDKSSMGAYDFEYKLAISSGVRSLFNVQPIEIMGTHKVEGVRFGKTTSINRRLEVIEGSEFEMVCDMVIKASGQGKQLHLFDLIEDISLDNKNKLVVNQSNYQTTNPKYFAGGDAFNGGAEVVNAAYEGKQAAIGIHNYLQD